MAEKNKKHSRLFFKVYTNYAIMVILFAMMLGAIFLQMIQRSAIASNQDKLVDHAKELSKRLHEYLIDEAYYQQGIDYVELIFNVLGEDEVWTISNKNAKNPMTSYLENVDLTDTKLSGEQIDVIEGAFNGEELIRTTFSYSHQENMLVIGIPIFNANREACGALVLNSIISDQSETVQSSMQLIVTSALLALIVSFFIAIIFARQITRPISKMRVTALELAEGRYETKTEIERNDEIGDLARTIDFLTDKLMENDKVRKNLEQMRVDFFANVSHELRTPITVVRAYTESLVDGVITEDEKRQQYYQKMLSECKSMERLVGDLLVLSKMQNPDFEVEAEPVNLMQIFDEIIRTVSTIGEDKNIRIDFQKDKDQYMMFGDYDRLRQMFLVILDNAVKFSPTDSVIDVKISQNERIEVSIRDEGIGIAKEELSSIFEKFYKSKLRQNAEGSGLGLAIAKQIAIKHSGDITVKSELGEGTEFIFSFQHISDDIMERMLFDNCGI